MAQTDEPTPEHAAGNLARELYWAEEETPRAPRRGSRGRARNGRGEVVPGLGARPPDGGVANLRHHRVQRAEGRYGDRPQVPGLPGSAREESGLADPPAPQRL